MLLLLDSLFIIYATLASASFNKRVVGASAYSVAAYRDSYIYVRA